MFDIVVEFHKKPKNPVPELLPGRLSIEVDPSMSLDRKAAFISVINRIRLTKEEQQHFQQTLLSAENFLESDKIEMDLSGRSVHIYQGGLVLSPTQSYSHDASFIFIDEEKQDSAIQCVQSYNLHTSAADVSDDNTYFDLVLARPAMLKGSPKIVMDMFRFINPIMKITYK